jgi:membrane protein implicated in regulation of membrane protease activity
MSQSIRNPYVTLTAKRDRKSAARPEKVEASRTLSGMLLAAVLSALLVVADQVIDTWVDGHMLAAWVALWTVAFATLALLAPPLRHVSSVLANMIAAWSHARAERRMEEKMWEYAQRDPRIMAELQQAWLRSQG